MGEWNRGTGLARVLKACGDTGHGAEDEEREAFALVGDDCSNGIGTCRRTGVYECNAAGDGVDATSIAYPDYTLMNILEITPVA